MDNFKKLYRDLEMKVRFELRVKVENSEYISKHTGASTIQVNVFDYTELTIIDDALVFLDKHGNDYSLT